MCIIGEPNMWLSKTQLSSTYEWETISATCFITIMGQSTIERTFIKRHTHTHPWKLATSRIDVHRVRSKALVPIKETLARHLLIQFNLLLITLIHLIALRRFRRKFIIITETHPLNNCRYDVNNQPNLFVAWTLLAVFVRRTFRVCNCVHDKYIYWNGCA